MLVAPIPTLVGKKVASELDILLGLDVLKAGARYILGDTLWSLLAALVTGFEVGLGEVPDDSASGSRASSTTSVLATRTTTRRAASRSACSRGCGAD